MAAGGKRGEGRWDTGLVRPSDRLIGGAVRRPAVGLVDMFMVRFSMQASQNTHAHKRTHADPRPPTFPWREGGAQRESVIPDTAFLTTRDVVLFRPAMMTRGCAAREELQEMKT